MSDELIAAPYHNNATTFVSGPPGAGKTTLAVRRLDYLLAQGVPAEQILILVPQRTLALPYYEYLHRADLPARGVVDVATIGGLARRTVDLFWPLAGEPAGFAQPHRRPHFLTLETAQYYMDRIAEKFLSEGAFDGVRISRARLVSQVIDNLNKAAAVRFPLQEIAPRLQRAWSGESAMLRIYDAVQAMALAFRQECLAGNRLDWSLQIEVLQQHLLPLPLLRRYLLSGYRHLIVDNVEEDIPATHDLLRLWLPLCESALLLYDADGGYRVFLGADPGGALQLAQECRSHIVMAPSRVPSPSMAALGAALARPFGLDPADAFPEIDPRPAFQVQSHHFQTEMVDWVADEVSRLVIEEQHDPAQIAILAPFLSDALRFSVTERLATYGIQAYTHRPSRQLREEPAVRCLLTLIKLAHPDWGYAPPEIDVAHALSEAIADLDPIRARILAQHVYRVRDRQPELLPFHRIGASLQQRITFLLGGRYTELQEWLARVQQEPADSSGVERLDHLISRLFGEILSQPGFGFRANLDAGQAAARLIESARKFYQAFPPAEPDEEVDPSAVVSLSREYVDMVERGVVAAQYLSGWEPVSDRGVLLVPAYTFLMMNRPVAIQFWLDAGSRSWYERIYQPLTHPYVLRRDWDEDRVWVDDDEVQVRDQALGRLILGLTRRCRERIYLAFSDLNDQGSEQQGPLWQATHRLLRQWQRKSP